MRRGREEMTEEEQRVMGETMEEEAVRMGGLRVGGAQEGLRRREN